MVRIIKVQVIVTLQKVGFPLQSLNNRYVRENYYLFVHLNKLINIPFSNENGHWLFL